LGPLLRQIKRRAKVPLIYSISL